MKETERERERKKTRACLNLRVRHAGITEPFSSHYITRLKKKKKEKEKRNGKKQ